MHSRGGCWTAAPLLDTRHSGGGRVVDFCMCINKRARLLFRWLVNRDKGSLEVCCFGGWLIHRALDWIRVLGAFGGELAAD